MFILHNKMVKISRFMQRKYTLGGGMVKMLTIMSNQSCTNKNLEQKKMGVFQ